MSKTAPGYVNVVELLGGRLSRKNPGHQRCGLDGDTGTVVITCEFPFWFSYHVASIFLNHTFSDCNDLYCHGSKANSKENTNGSL